MILFSNIVPPVNSEQEFTGHLVDNLVNGVHSVEFAGGATDFDLSPWHAKTITEAVTGTTGEMELCFTPKSGHHLSALGCQLSAKGGQAAQ